MHVLPGNVQSIAVADLRSRAAGLELCRRDSDAASNADFAGGEARTDACDPPRLLVVSHLPA